MLRHGREHAAFGPGDPLILYRVGQFRRPFCGPLTAKLTAMSSHNGLASTTQLRDRVVFT